MNPTKQLFNAFNKKSITPNGAVVAVVVDNYHVQTAQGIQVVAKSISNQVSVGDTVKVSGGSITGKRRDSSLIPVYTV